MTAGNARPMSGVSTTNAGLVLCHRLRRWHNTKPTFGGRLVGNSFNHSFSHLARAEHPPPAAVSWSGLCCTPLSAVTSGSARCEPPPPCRHHAATITSLTLVLIAGGRIAPRDRRHQTTGGASSPWQRHGCKVPAREDRSFTRRWPGPRL